MLVQPSIAVSGADWDLHSGSPFLSRDEATEASNGKPHIIVLDHGQCHTAQEGPMDLWYLYVRKDVVVAS